MSGDSMNVYGSYIDDSYVGDFSGEVTNPEVMIDEVVGGVLEFSFDSFGPESMIFPKNGEPSEVDDNINNTTYNNTTNQPVEFLKRNTSLTQSQRRKIRPKIDIQEIFNSSDETSAHDDSTVNNLIENETSKEDLDDEDDGQSNFNENPENKSYGNSNTSSNTQANSYSNTKEDNYFKHDTHYLDSSPVSTKEELEDTLQKQGSFAKKKIPVNKELLSNDDMIIDFPPSHQEQEVNRVPELTAQEEMIETRSWRESCPIGDKGEVKKIDLKVIEPYKKVLSHGGYYHHYNSAQLSKNNTNPSPGPAIIIFSACYLPDRSRKDYRYVMDNLFMYVLTTLHELVADDYILIYFHNAGCAGVSSNNMPTFSWLKRCYTMIDKRLRKNLKSLFLVHPTFWLKTFVIMIKPFISSKFSKKLKFVSTLAELNDLVPIESTVIPPPVKQGSSRIKEAIELFIKRGNMFKKAKKWMAAGNSFIEAAALQLKSDNKQDAASCYVDAGNCYKKVDPQEAVNSILKAIEIYTDMGRFSIAAKHHMTVAEIYENEAVDIEKAIAHFEQAADYYKGEESSASANRCLLNVARYAAQLEQYSKAIGIYESVASSSIDNSLLKYSAKEHFFRAALCHMCVDLLNAQLAIKRYEEMYPAFTDSRECKFVKGLLDKLEESDVEGFTQQVQEYDSISRLDQWFTTILLKIKKQIQQEPDLK